jgi:tRNA (guanine-N7-)-methyltransferase
VTLQDLLAGRGGAAGCEVEIGCGNGHFLTEYAAEKPGTLLIGVDIKKGRCAKARDKAEKRGLSNVTIVQGLAEILLQDLPSGCVDAFHIYFPDPWPKSRHRKRRFFTMENLRRLHAKLREGGMIYFGTDFFDYYLQAKVLVVVHGGFRLIDEAAPPAVRNSLYGMKASGADKDVHLFTAVRIGSPEKQGQQQEHDRGVDGHIGADAEG